MKRSMKKSGQQETIVLVDDSLENLKLLIAFLEDADFRIVVAQSGEEALLRARDALPDLILLDICMPGMDGFETCFQLKQDDRTKDIPVIFMSVLSETIDKVKGFQSGGVDYITKPIQQEELLARIHTHIRLRQLEWDLQQQKERFQQLAEASFEGIVLHRAGHIIDVNETLLQMCGIQRSQAIGMTVSELFHEDSRQFVIKQIQQEREYPCEASCRRIDGSMLPVEFQSRILPTSRGRQGEGIEMMVTAVRELSWKKKMEAEQRQLQHENLTLKSSMKNRYRFGDIIGKSQIMQELYESIVKAAASDANILISGESGTGKELVARTIHALSARKSNQFVPVNCSAIPETLFESEFFGYRKGAFTGATTERSGYLDSAHHGSLFLDEVGELNLLMQAKLLRALQDGEYTPLGGNSSKNADVRIIAATNQDLHVMLLQKEIREDFFYRIHVIVLHLPPLRERKEDLPLLLDHFLHVYAKDTVIPTLPGEVLEALYQYDWPGNVRELQNEIQRYLAEQHLEFSGSIMAEPVLGDGKNFGAKDETQGFYEKIEALEKRLIVEALAQNSGHRKHTAAMLKILPKTLQRKMKKYDLL